MIYNDLNILLIVPLILGSNISKLSTTPANCPKILSGVNCLSSVIFSLLILALAPNSINALVFASVQLANVCLSASLIKFFSNTLISSPCIAKVALISPPVLSGFSFRIASKLIEADIVLRFISNFKPWNKLLIIASTRSALSAGTKYLIKVDKNTLLMVISAILSPIKKSSPSLAVANAAA